MRWRSARCAGKAGRREPMTPALAIPLFVASIALMLLASAVFARRLDHIGLRLGLPETLLGLLTALAANAPELASAVPALITTTTPSRSASPSARAPSTSLR